MDEIHVAYYCRDLAPEFGKSRGAICSLSPAAFTGNAKSHADLGCCVIRRDLHIVDALLSGENTVDVDRTTSEKLVLSASRDDARIRATRIVTMAQSNWQGDSLYQEPTERAAYREYADVFRESFARAASAASKEERTRAYPEPLLSPSRCQVLVARDAIAFLYEGPYRPCGAEVRVDVGKVLDELLVPHPAGKTYSSAGPLVVARAICDDTRFKWIVGGGGGDVSYWGTPRRVVLEPRYHLFWENLRIVRVYPDGTVADRFTQFCEVFGRIGAENFSASEADRRGKLYAAEWLRLNRSRSREGRDSDNGPKNRTVTVAHGPVDKRRFAIQRDAPCPCGSGRKYKHCWAVDTGQVHVAPQPARPILRDTGKSLTKCYARSLCDCEGKISAEHYISEAALRQMDPRGGGWFVRGMPWQKEGSEEGPYGRRSLTVNVLCERHNSGLSDLDRVALRFFEATDALCTYVYEGRVAPPPTNVWLFNGHDIERWLLKVLLGTSEGQGGRAGEPIDYDLSAMVPKVFGYEPFPAGWGLHVNFGKAPVFPKKGSVKYRPITRYEHGELCGLELHVRGLWMELWCVPDMAMARALTAMDGPAFRPGTITMRKENRVGHIVLEWMT